MNELTDMRGLYREILRDRRRELQSSLTRHAVDGEPGGVRALAHKIAGSGSAFGFPRITSAARALELGPSAEIGARGAELLAAMDAVLESQRHRPVLLATPDTVWARAFETALAAAGFPLTWKRTGAEALSVLREEEVALVVADLLLPDQDGRRFLADLRDNGLNSCVPVFVLAPRVNDDLRNECLAYGAVRCFQKPVPYDGLVQAIAEKINAKASTETAEGLLGRVGLSRLYHRAETLRQGLQTPWTLAVIEPAGEDAGGSDSAEARLGALLQRQVQNGGAVGRWEAGRYVVLFMEEDPDRAERLLASFRDPPAAGPEDVDFQAGLVDLRESLSIEEAVARAGSALRSARAAGRPFARFREDQTVARKTVLLAEDDELVVALVRHRLEKEGFSVRCFSDGAEALQAVGVVNPHLVVLDVKMPGMDGFEVLERLRAQPAFARTPVLMLTSMGDEANVVKGLTLGANDYILKPFSPAELVARVHRHLKAG